MYKIDKEDIAAISLVGVVFATVVMYLINIYKLVTTIIVYDSLQALWNSPDSVMAFFRAIGIFIAPLGAILGFF